MKKAELLRIINEIVKKQVQKEINKIFIKEDKELTLTDAVTFTPKEEKREMKSLAKDPVLNKILNETQGGVPQGEKSPYPTMGGGTNNQVAREIGAVQTMKQAGVDPKQMPAVADAMTRDYRGLMKAMDKNKGNK